MVKPTLYSRVLILYRVQCQGHCLHVASFPCRALYKYPPPKKTFSMFCFAPPPPPPPPLQNKPCVIVCCTITSGDLLPYFAGQVQHLPQSAVEQHPHVPSLQQGREQYTHPAHECVVYMCVHVCVGGEGCMWVRVWGGGGGVHVCIYVCVCVCVCVCVGVYRLGRRK